MEPITTILLQALPVLAGAAGTELAKRTVAEAWDRLKQAVQRRFGADHEAPRLLDDLRATGGQGDVPQYLAARLAQLPLAQDPEILALAQQLAAALPAASATAGNIAMSANTMVGAIGQVGGSVTQHFHTKT